MRRNESSMMNQLKAIFSNKVCRFCLPLKTANLRKRSYFLIEKKPAFKRLFLALLTFSILGFKTAYAGQSSDVAGRIVPIISALLLDEDTPYLTIGELNNVVLSNDQRPPNASAEFSGVSDGLLASLVVSGLDVNQSLNVMVNGNLSFVISSNGAHQFEIINSFLNAGSVNIIEFVSSPIDAQWQVDQIRLLNAEGPYTRAEAVRFLVKASFGATENSIQRVLQLGYSGWIDEQVLMSPTLHVPYFDQQVAAHGVAGISGRSFNCGVKTQAWLNGAVFGEDQLLQRMAYALSQIFVVGDNDCDSIALRYTHYYDVLINGGLGNYRDLLENVTLTSAMGDFLSLSGSNANPIYNSTPDENYARELMQLFTIGVFELNIDGSLKLEDGKPIDTYTDEIVFDTARALSGWIRDTETAPFPYNQYAPLIPWNGLWQRWHDHGEKTIVNGIVLPAGDTENQTGNNIIDDLEAVLDAVFQHDNIAPFVSKQLIQRFVTSNPSPQYIERVARVFNDNGSGVKGDLSAVIKAVLLDSESLNSHENPISGKLKEPLLRATQLWRAFGANSEVGYLRYLAMTRDFGQRPLGASSVFNFYRPDYAPLGEIFNRGMVAPEFKLMGDSFLLWHLPAMQDLLDSRPVDSNDIVNGNLTSLQNISGTLDLTDAIAVASNTTTLMNYLNDLLFGGLMSAQLEERVIQYVDDEVIYGSDLSELERLEKKVEEALFILGVSPEFNIQR